MAKKIIYCSDGTWNAGARTNTNVFRLYCALEPAGEGNRPGGGRAYDKRIATQTSFYDEGVGVQGWIVNRLRGGAFGDGLIENVREGYEKIAKVYQEGDRIYLFGFSRGAYTARSLGGMIAYCGLPTGTRDGGVTAAAFEAYRNRKKGETKWSDPPQAAEMVDAKIVMVGVWDTIGRLGVPRRLFLRTVADNYEFLDTRLHPDVDAGYHALSVDENRRPFEPTLWRENAANNQIIKQVWFAGVHGDVGGAPDVMRRRTDLSEITLAWMLDKAAKHGVEIDPTAAPNNPRLPLAADVALAPIRDLADWLWVPSKERTIRGDATVANSVAVRIARDRWYRPRPLTVNKNPRRLSGSYLLEPVVTE